MRHPDLVVIRHGGLPCLGLTLTQDQARYLRPDLTNRSDRRRLRLRTLANSGLQARQKTPRPRRVRGSEEMGNKSEPRPSRRSRDERKKGGYKVPVWGFRRQSVTTGPAEEGRIAGAVDSFARPRVGPPKALAGPRVSE